MVKSLYWFGLLILISIAQAENLVITEIMYDPEGNDQGREWIEVFNQSNQTFVVKSGKDGWRINDGTNHLFKESITISPREVFIIAQDKVKFLNDYPNFKGKIVLANFSLKNSSAKIQIFDDKKTLLVERNYQSSCGGSGNGYSLVFENNFCYEGKINKGTPGIYPEKMETSTKSQINSRTLTSTENNTATTFFLTSTEISDLSGIETEMEIPTIYISEFFPNPDGNDKDKEFVEFYNFGDKEVSLSDISLEINNRKISLSGTIAPGQYFVFKNKINIRNSGEKLVLFWQNEKIFEISYQGKAPESLSFARDNNGNWQFTQPTPGKKNVFNHQSKEPNLGLISERRIEKGEQQIFELKNTTSNIRISENKNYFLLLLSAIVVIVLLTIFVWLKL